MRMWRYAVVTYLRAAQAAGSLISDSSENDLKQLFIREYQRPFWIIRISRSMPKWHFLQYAARYARRPAIAQGRILEFNAVSVQFLTKNRKAKFVVPIGRFVGELAEHVPDRYRHGIRYFGLWAPGTKADVLAAVFAILGQHQRAHPKRLGWRECRRRLTGIDPLIDIQGNPMCWVRREKPLVR
jgi:Putative transposase